MPVPTSINDLSTTPGDNSPSGGENIGTNLDNYLRAGFAFTKQLHLGAVAAPSTSLASATTVNIGAATTPTITITGTTTITAFDTAADGIKRDVTFSGALTLTHNATSLILPGGANITTTEGDCATFLSLGSGNWRCIKYQYALGAGIAPRVMGLTGNVNATTPLTKFNLAADAVTLRDAGGATVTRYNTGTITCDLGLSGPAANGRDQSGAFTASSSINLFFIWNGATLATIASTASHTTGPTLPNGYTHWCYATTIRWNSSSNIIKVYVRGTKVYYAALNDGEVSIGFSSATETSISTASYVPSNAASYVVRCRTSNSSTGNRSISLKLISGSSFDIAFVEAGGTVTNHFELPNVGNSFIAEVSEATTVTADIYVRSYVVSNGDS